MKIKCRLEQCNGHDGSLRESKYRLDPGTAWVKKGPGETLSVLKAGNRAIENKRFSPCEQYIGARSEFETPNLWELMLLIIDYKPRLKSWGAIAVACLLSACSTLSPTQEPRSQDSLLTDDLTATTRYQALSGDIRPREVADKEPSSVILGSGEFVNTRIAGRAPIIRNEQGEITLNFELADIRDVVKVVFDTLQENYILDPGVQGEVTVQTSSPLPKDVLLPTLETLLRQVGAAIVRSQGVYKIVPVGTAVRGNLTPKLGGTKLGPGFSVRIFPLRYISVTEMETILQPFAPEGGIQLVDPVRNLLILAGTDQELNYLQETIETFDVNWLKGMSVGMYPLQNVDAQDVADELSKLFGPDSGLPFAGLFRFVPIIRLNAVLVITPQPEYLKEVTAWIERLDEGGGERLYVYDVQNGSAEYLAGLLGDVFNADSSGGGQQVQSTSGQVAPGQTPSQISSGGTSANLAVFQLQQPDELSGVPPLQHSQISGGLGRSNDNVRIIADEENNSLLIWADTQTYDKISSALTRLDRRPRQVLIEATIAEVGLNDELEYGIQWFFKNGFSNSSKGGVGALGSTSNPGALSATEFGYAITDAAGAIRLLLTTLASESRARVLSSPQVLVIDNQEAKIQVGDQVPFRTSTSSTTTSTTSNIEFKDTGVILSVKPEIKAGGLIRLEISQEVITLGETPEGIDQPPLNRRSVESNVAVESGQTIVLGGLITETSLDSSAGLPGLHNLPVLGGLFGSKSDDYQRRELVILITPTVIETSADAVQIANELRERMRGVIPIESPWKQPIEEIGRQRRFFKAP